MALKKIIYFENKKKKTIKVKVLTNPLSKGIGLIFKKKSPPLLFPNKFKTLPITSLFCKPFKAIWLDDKMHVIKTLDIKTWKFYIPGYGKYLLEIPLHTTKN